jgi:nucleotide-binding universal stress UspA family protein
MGTKAIISYDGTETDRDALALGLMLAPVVGSLSLAYVRHAEQSDPGHEELEQEEAEQLLEKGVALLGCDAKSHVITDASTANGLLALVQQEHANVIVFGSEYHTAPGHVKPGISAQKMLVGGPTAVAIAPAGLYNNPGKLIAKVGYTAEIGDESSRETAQSLAESAGAELVAVTDRTSADPSIDFLVVGSKPFTSPGKTVIGAADKYLLELSTCPVLVLPREVAVDFTA